MKHDDIAPVIKKYHAGILISMIFSAVAAVLYTIAYHQTYDSTLQHYETGSRLIWVAAAFFVLAILCALGTAVSLRGKVSFQNPSEEEMPVIFCLNFVAFMFIGYCIVSTFIAPDEGNSVFIRLCPMLGLVSAIPFLCEASKRVRGSVFHMAASLIPIFWAGSVLFKYYYDFSSVSLNAPERNLTNVALSALLIFFLSDARSALRINTPPLMSFATITTASVAGMISAARIIIFYMNGGSAISVMENILIFSISLLALARLTAAAHNFCAYSPRQPETNQEEPSVLSEPQKPDSLPL